MKTCICTVIKNEHQYLDEWIQYHLRLGIDYIFIFEDIDSESHKDITDKYDRVSLSLIKNILNDEDYKKAVILKETKKHNPQHIYFRNALNYIKNLGEYDWCFIIDNDEFITLENTKTLQDSLSQFENYDAVIIQWECYGANEYVSTPNYNKNGLVQTYLLKITGSLPDRRDSFVKTCYNLRKYTDDMFYNQHHPNDKCNWVNTNFQKTYIEQTYRSIYIRHYVTKSWEEFVYKKIQRGFMWGGTRGFDMFFKSNPELKCVKTELMEALKDEILVILPYKQSSAQGTELELTLSLWRKNCTFNYHFVVIGEYDKSFEEKFPWVEFIECPTKPKVNGQYNPHLDILNKYMTVIDKYQDKYTGFVSICDDEYAIKPFTLFDILQTHYHAETFTGVEKAPTSYWNHDKWKTRQLLDRENLQHVNYTTHFPYWYDIKKLRYVVDKFNLMNESYVLEDVYFNYYEHDKPVLDSRIRLGIWDSNIYRKDFQRALEKPDIKFMCNSVEGWSEELEESLKKLIDEQ